MALITTPETATIIGCAMRVHTELGPGLLERAYCQCLAVEFSAVGLRFAREVPLELATYLRLTKLQKGLKDGIKSVILPG